MSKRIGLKLPPNNGAELDSELLKGNGEEYFPQWLQEHQPEHFQTKEEFSVDGMWRKFGRKPTIKTEIIPHKKIMRWEKTTKTKRREKQYVRAELSHPTQ